jgi:hypothetical protein
MKHSGIAVAGEKAGSITAGGIIAGSAGRGG